jgi:hypothetical protein
MREVGADIVLRILEPFGSERRPGVGNDRAGERGARGDGQARRRHAPVRDSGRKEHRQRVLAGVVDIAEDECERR